jgi:hypothetical protein
MNLKGTAKNLRAPWRKGEPSPNPSGRPKRLPISDVYAQLAVQPIPESILKILQRDGVPLGPDTTFADGLATQMWLQALRGDILAAREIRESIEGKSPTRTEIKQGPTEVAPKPDYTKIIGIIRKVYGLNKPPSSPEISTVDNNAEPTGDVPNEVDPRLPEIKEKK